MKQSRSAQPHQRGTTNARSGDRARYGAKKTSAGESTPVALQRIAIGNQATGMLFATKSRDANPAQRDVDPTVMPGGRVLDPQTQASMEGIFGASFSDVRVHTDRAGAAMAGSLGAIAFTSGAHIVFSEGSYQPSSSAGRALLVHELTHVLQQRGGSRSQPPAAPGTLEAEAERVGRAGTAGGALGEISTGAAPQGVVQCQLQQRVVRYPDDPEKDAVWWNLTNNPESWPNFAMHPKFDDVLLENPAVFEVLDRLPEFRAWKRDKTKLPARFVSAPGAAPEGPPTSAKALFMESFHRAATLKQKGEALLTRPLPEFYGYYERLADQAAAEVKQLLGVLIPVVGALGWDLMELAMGETAVGRPVDRLRKSIDVLWQIANIGMLFIGPKGKLPGGGLPPGAVGEELSALKGMRETVIELPGGGRMVKPPTAAPVKPSAVSPVAAEAGGGKVISIEGRPRTGTFEGLKPSQEVTDISAFRTQKKPTPPSEPAAQSVPMAAEQELAGSGKLASGAELSTPQSSAPQPVASLGSMKKGKLTVAPPAAPTTTSAATPAKPAVASKPPVQTSLKPATAKSPAPGPVVVRFGTRQRRELSEFWAKRIAGAKTAQEKARFRRYFDIVRQRGRPGGRGKQSETEMEFYHRTIGGQPEVSYRLGKEVARGTAGSTRPDLVTNALVEVKNYRIANRGNLIRELERQITARAAEGPVNIRQQTVILDLRGQRVLPSEIRQLARDISARTGVPIDHIQVLTW